ncbi:ABC transporter permease [Aeromicrobium fastidiosum]|nr:ABC transporter permease [Aeromicrobium fastidiosum]MBP2389600.1 peptide/nickel transport system permease protein [Aeromicrobium fastidiosum]
MTVLAPPTRSRLRARRIPGLSGPVPVIISVAIIVVMVVVAVAAPLIAPFDPDAVDLNAFLSSPGTAGHLMGTDGAGRDILSRVMFGARLSLLAPLVVVIVSTLLGTVLGLACGWLGGAVDSFLSRVIEFLFAFPSLLVAMLAVALFGPGLLAPTIGLMIAYTPYTARLVRNLVLQEKARPYIEAYRVQGYSGTAIATRKIVPNISPTLLAQSALGFGYVMVDLAALSYLGLGVQPPTSDWGVMVAEGQDALVQSVIWPVLFPCLAIVAVVIAVNIIGDYIGEKLTGGSIA